MIKIIKNKWSSFKYRLKYNWEFLKIYNSPFERPKIHLYIGKAALGVPYYLPRKWVNSKDGGSVAKPLTVGFKMCGLGWKTKWEDIRHEWNPRISFVFFGKQIALTFTSGTEYDASYWEAWIYYEKYTDKNDSVEERLLDCFNKKSCTWVSTVGEKKVTVNHYEYILKKKWIKKFFN